MNFGTTYLRCKTGKCTIDTTVVCQSSAEIGAACGFDGQMNPLTCQMNSTGGMECLPVANLTECGAMKGNYKCTPLQACTDMMDGICVPFGSIDVDGKCNPIMGPMGCKANLICQKDTPTATTGTCKAPSVTACGTDCTTTGGSCGCGSAAHQAGCFYHGDCQAKVDALKTCATTNLCDLSMVGPLTISMYALNHGDCIFDKCAAEFSAAYCCMTCTKAIESPNWSHTTFGINCQVTPATYTKPNCCDVDGTGIACANTLMNNMYCLTPPTSATTKNAACRLSFF